MHTHGRQRADPHLSRIANSSVLTGLAATVTETVWVSIGRLTGTTSFAADRETPTDWLETGIEVW